MKPSILKLLFMFFIVVLIGAAVKIGATTPFFSDTETSTNNALSVADSFGPPIANHLVINEVYYDPDSSHKHPASADERDFEWIEIYNPTGSIVNLKNWKIVDNSATERSISTSNRDLGPGEFAILAKAANVFTLWSIPTSAIKIPIGERFGNGLANDGDRVILKDPNGTIIDQMSYGTDTTVLNPTVPGIAEGHSLERDPDGVDTDTAADFVDRSLPTPGL